MKTTITSENYGIKHFLRTSQTWPCTGCPKSLHKINQARIRTLSQLWAQVEGIGGTFDNLKENFHYIGHKHGGFAKNYKLLGSVKANCQFFKLPSANLKLV